MKNILVLFWLLICVCVGLSQEKQIKFTDGSKLSINKGNTDPNLIKLTGKLIRKEVVANFIGLGKARELTPLGRLSDAVFQEKGSNKITSKENKIFFNKIDKITTEYEFKQDDSEFYSNGLSSIQDAEIIKELNSINRDQSKSGNTCEVKLKLMLIEIEVKGELFYTPVIVSIERLKAGK